MKKIMKYENKIYVLDYETTNYTAYGREHSLISKWALVEEEVIASGNDIISLKEFLDRTNDNLKKKIIIFIPNMSLFYPYLKGIHDFGNDDVFAVDAHKVLYCLYGNIEFRCLKYHSNMEMDEYTTKYGDTVYTNGADLIANCEAMRSAIKNEMAVEGDKYVYSIPNTSTGYVRREVKRVMSTKGMYKWHENMVFDADTYKLLDSALHGGNCIANRFMIGEIIENVKSADRCSAYTDSILNHKFPMKFFHEGACSLEWYKRMRSRNKAIVMKVALWDIRLKDEYNPAPYIDINHCSVKKGLYSEIGRVISCDYLETTVTDIDMDIIEDQYDIGCMKILDLSHARYAPLPEALKNVQRKYYKIKTELKNVEGQELYYIKNKAKNNAIAGLLQERPIRENYTCIDGEFVPDSNSFEEKLAKYNKDCYVSFAWGVWCTAWARWELQKAINLAGDNFIYSDTDSIKYTGDIDFTQLNNEKEECDEWAVDNIGTVHYVGVWEQEKTADRFCTLGQKKYIVENDGECTITVSGLDKVKGSKLINIGDEYGSGIERFQLSIHHSYTFYNASAIRPIYNNIKPFTLNGVTFTSNVVLKPSEFKLGGKETDFDAIIKNGDLSWNNI